MRRSAIVTVRKILEKAGHPTTPDSEAMTAVRTVKGMLATYGLSFDNLTIQQQDDDEDGEQVSRLSMIQTINRLERQNRSLTTENAEVVDENNRLVAQATRMAAEIARLERIVKTHDAGAEPLPRRPAELTYAGPKVDEESAETLKEESMQSFGNEQAQPEHSTPMGAFTDHRDTEGPDTGADAVGASQATEEAVEESAEESPARTKRRYNRDPNIGERRFDFDANDDVHKRMIELYFSGLGKEAISAKLKEEFPGRAPSFSQVFSRTGNGRPPAFLDARVKTGGPIDWAEAWLIGSTLYAKNRSWLGPTLAQLGVKAPSSGLSFDLNAHTSPEAVDKFRELYHWHASTTKPAKKDDEAA